MTAESWIIPALSVGFCAGCWCYILIDHLAAKKMEREAAADEAERLRREGVNQLLSKAISGDREAIMDCAKLMSQSWPSLEADVRHPEGVIRNIVSLGRLRVTNAGLQLKILFLKFRNSLLKLRAFRLGLTDRTPKRADHLAEIQAATCPHQDRDADHA